MTTGKLHRTGPIQPPPRECPDPEQPFSSRRTRLRRSAFSSAGISVALGKLSVDVGNSGASMNVEF
jgi:hypothetical protein